MVPAAATGGCLRLLQHVLAGAMAETHAQEWPMVINPEWVAVAVSLLHYVTDLFRRRRCRCEESPRDSK